MKPHKLQKVTQNIREAFWWLWTPMFVGLILVGLYVKFNPSLDDLVFLVQQAGIVLLYLAGIMVFASIFLESILSIVKWMDGIKNKKW